MSIYTSTGSEAHALKKKVSFWHDDVTVLRSISHLSHYSSSSSGYEGSNELGTNRRTVQDGQRIKKKRNDNHHHNKTKNSSTYWPPLPLEADKDLPPHYTIEHKPALHRVIPKDPSMPARGRRSTTNTGMPLPQIRLSKTFCSGLSYDSNSSNNRSGFQLYPEEAPLPPLLLVPEDALDRKRQADSRGLSSAAPARKKSFGNLSLFIPKLAPKQSSSTLSQAAAAAEIHLPPPGLDPPIKIEVPKKRASKIPESISLQNFKRAARSGFRSSKYADTFPLESLVKGPKTGVDSMEHRTRKIRQSEAIQKVPISISRPRYGAPETVTARYSPATLRRRLEQPLPPLPIHSQYVQQQQQRLRRQSEEDLQNHQQQRLRRESQENLLQHQQLSRRQSQEDLLRRARLARRQSQESLLQQQRLRRQSQENLLQQQQQQRLLRRQSQEDLLQKQQQQRLLRRQSQEQLLEQQKQRLKRESQEDLEQLQQQKLPRHQSQEDLTPKRQIPEKKLPQQTHHRRHTTLEEDLKAWKEKYHTIAHLPTNLTKPEHITDDRKRAIAATLNSLKVLKRQSVGPDLANLTISSDPRRRSDASSNRTLVNLFNKPEEKTTIGQPRRKEVRTYKEEEFDVNMTSHPPSNLSNQHEDMDGVKLQTYIAMHKAAKSTQSFWVGRYISLKDRLINTYPYEKDEVRNRMLWGIFAREVELALGSEKWDEFIRFKNNMRQHCWDVEEKEREDSD